MENRGDGGSLGVGQWAGTRPVAVKSHLRALANSAFKLVTLSVPSALQLRTVLYGPPLIEFSKVQLPPGFTVPWVGEWVALRAVTGDAIIANCYPNMSFRFHDVVDFGCWLNRRRTRRTRSVNIYPPHRSSRRRHRTSPSIIRPTREKKTVPSSGTGVATAIPRRPSNNS